MTLDNSINIFSKEIWMKFRINSWVRVFVNRGKLEPVQCMATNTVKITDVETDKGYKYLEILQRNDFLQDKIKV